MVFVVAVWMWVSLSPRCDADFVGSCNVLFLLRRLFDVRCSTCVPVVDKYCCGCASTNGALLSHTNFDGATMDFPDSHTFSRCCCKSRSYNIRERLVIPPRMRSFHRWHSPRAIPAAQNVDIRYCRKYCRIINHLSFRYICRPIISTSIVYSVHVRPPAQTDIKSPKTNTTLTQWANNIDSFNWSNCARVMPLGTQNAGINWLFANEQLDILQLLHI